MPLVNQVIPSSSPITTPVKPTKKRKLAHCEPQRLFAFAGAGSPESIHSSDGESHSSQLVSSTPANQKFHSEPLPLSIPPGTSASPSNSKAKAPVSSSQEELEDIALGMGDPHKDSAPDLDQADITIESDDESFDTQWYVRQYCSESVLANIL